MCGPLKKSWGQLSPVGLNRNIIGTQRRQFLETGAKMFVKGYFLRIVGVGWAPFTKDFLAQSAGKMFGVLKKPKNRGFVHFFIFIHSIIDSLSPAPWQETHHEVDAGVLHGTAANRPEPVLQVSLVQFVANFHNRSIALCRYLAMSRRLRG